MALAIAMAKGNANKRVSSKEQVNAALELISRAVQFRNADTRRQLVALLDHRSYEVRLRSAEALGVVTHGHAPPQLIRALTDETNELVRSEIADSLGAIGDRRARRALRRALIDSSPIVRGYAASALGEVGDARDAHVLRRRLRVERNTQAAAGLLHGLSALGDSEAVLRLVALLQHSNYRVRATAANLVATLRLRSDTRTMVLRRLRKAKASEKTVAAQSSIRNAMRTLTTQIRPVRPA